jgi:hypothetical protein
MPPRVQKPLAGAAILAAAMSLSSTLVAQPAVVAAPAESSELREIRIAVSASPSRNNMWFNLRLVGAADDVYAVVPVPLGARLDLSSDAWFEALQEATLPRIVPPSSPPAACAALTRPSADAFESVGDSRHDTSLPPEMPLQVHSFAQLVLWAQGAGLQLSMELATRLADLELQGNRFVALHYQPSPGETLTRTVRISPAPSSPSAPVLLTRTGAARVPVTLWILAHGRVSPASSPAVRLDARLLKWKLGGAPPLTNYQTLWESAVGPLGNDWVVDSSSHDALFRTVSFASGTESIGSVASTYFERAAGYGDGLPQYAVCAANAAALEANEARVSPACARGDLSVVSDDPGKATCSEHPAAGEIDPQVLRCGDRTDDLALALSGLSPAKVWLTRWSSFIPAWESRLGEHIQHDAGPALSPVLVASGYDTPACAQDGGTSDGAVAPAEAAAPATDPPDAAVADPSQGGYPANPGAQGAQDPAFPEDPPGGATDDDVGTSDEPVGGVLDVWVPADPGCSGDTSSSSSADSCSGDSSSSSDSSADSCSGDSSSSSDSSGDSCSGDSSSSSSSSGDSCSGDTSSSSGSSSNSSSGDSCSGGSSSGSSSSSDCSISGKGKRRWPTSAMTMLIAGVLLPLRRLRLGVRTKR